MRATISNVHTQSYCKWACGSPGRSPFIDPDGNRSHFFSLTGLSDVLFELIQWAGKPR